MNRICAYACRWSAFAALTLLLASAAARADLEAGYQAFLGKDYATALLEWRPPAAHGEALAQYNLGELYAHGWGVPKDQRAAEALFRRAAEQGLARAQYRLGQLYTSAAPPLRDEVEAAHWYREAALQGDSEAQTALALMYYTGRGVSHNREMAQHWFLEAARNGVVQAQFNVGLILETGEGLARNNEEAAQWYRQAAAAGSANAAYALGLMYAQGRGVQQDALAAIYLMSKAAQQGHDQARGYIAAHAADFQHVRLEQSLALRDRPDPHAGAVTRVAPGSRVWILARQLGWVEIYLPRSHRIGWLLATEPQAPPPQLIRDISSRGPVSTPPEL